MGGDSPSNGWLANKSRLRPSFTQSYNYFPWRNPEYELTTYLAEITRPEIADYFR
jgi:starch synthase (maltosyl-transferring)